MIKRNTSRLGSMLLHCSHRCSSSASDSAGAYVRNPLSLRESLSICDLMIKKGNYVSFNTSMRGKHMKKNNSKTYLICISFRFHSYLSRPKGVETELVQCASLSSLSSRSLSCFMLPAEARSIGTIINMRHRLILKI